MTTRPKSGTTRAWAGTVGVATLVAVCCGAIAAPGEVPGWEEALFHGVNGLSDRLEPLMWVFQLAGLLLVPLLAAVAALLFRRWRVALALLLLVPAKLIVEHLVVKQLVERERPGTTICGYPDLEPDCANFRGDVPLEGLSFVSGHAIIAWGIATILWPALPGRWRWLPIGIATLNAVARVYLGAHNPLDVIGGAAIGVALGGLLVLATSWRRRPAPPDGGHRPPAPTR